MNKLERINWYYNYFRKLKEKYFLSENGIYLSMFIPEGCRMDQIEGERKSCGDNILINGYVRIFEKIVEDRDEALKARILEAVNPSTGEHYEGYRGHTVKCDELKEVRCTVPSFLFDDIDEEELKVRTNAIFLKGYNEALNNRIEALQNSIERSKKEIKKYENMMLSEVVE